MNEIELKKTDNTQNPRNGAQRLSLFLQLGALAAACSALVMQQEFFEANGFLKSMWWFLLALALYISGRKSLLGLKFTLSQYIFFGCSCFISILFFGVRAALPFLLGAGASLVALATVNKRFHFIAEIMLEFSVLVLSALAVLTLTASLAAKTDSLPLLPDILAFLWRLSGERAATMGEMLVVENMHFAWPVRVSFTQVGMLWILPFAVVSTIALFRFNSLKTSGLWLFALLFIYPFWRFLLLISVYLKWEVAEFFFSPGVEFFLSLMPITVITFISVPKIKTEIPAHTSDNRASFRSFAFPLAITTLLVCGILLPNPGTPKKGRVLVDEAHGPWEWSVEDFSRDWYGGAATYNYNCITDFMDRFFTVDSINEPLSLQSLSECDVLILKTPTEPFKEEEINAVRQWVKGGGGLYLIGDHTNVFGMTDFLNPMAQKFGMQFEYDSTYDLETGSLQVSRDNTYWRGTALNHMPKQFLWGTSCSMTAELRVSCDFIGRHIRTRYLDYGQKSNFASSFLFPRDRYGPILQMASRRYGKGRVFAFSDSTVFSNFWAFFSGKSEIFVGVVNWLNYKNTINLPFLFLIMGSVVWFIYSFRRFRFSAFFSNAVATAPLALVLAVFLSDKAADIFYPFPKPRREIRYVYFDRKFSDINMPDIEMTGSSVNSFQTFFTWIQKLDLIPKCVYNLHELKLRQKDILMIIYPSIFSEKALKTLYKYIQEGGTVMILDGANNSNSKVNLWIRPFGISINYRHTFEGVLKDINGVDLFQDLNLASVPEVKGGEPLLMCGFHPVLCRLDLGKGRLFVSSLGDQWTDPSLGISNSEPNAQQEKLAGTVYYLMEQAFPVSDQVALAEQKKESMSK